MTDTKALFLIGQLNPILAKSTSYIRKLELDPDNQDIMLINLCRACMHRINYTGRNQLQVAYDIFDYLRS